MEGLSQSCWDLICTVSSLGSSTLNYLQGYEHKCTSKASLCVCAVCARLVLAAAVLILFAGLQLLDKNSCLFPVLTAMQYPDRCKEEQEDVSVLVPK